jgi:hypothetical protein
MRALRFPIFLTIILLCAEAALCQQRQFQFDQFPATVYRGQIQVPPGVARHTASGWIDEGLRSVLDPEVNFAGEYWLLAHSCGTYCRWYSLSNLRTGKEIRDISQFATAEPTPMTKDGIPYLTILYSQPNSRLLIAEYHLNFDVPNQQETCRQRYFLLDAGKINPISKTFPFCTEDLEK